MVLELLKKEFRMNTSRVVEDYDKFLRKALITTTSFQDIVSGRLNRRNRLLQLIFLIHLILFTLPRYITLCYLYTRIESTRLRYQYLLADYGEELGLCGRALNVCYIVVGIEVTLNLLVMRKYESSTSLEYLTDWLHRIPRITHTEEIIVNESGHENDGDLDNESKHRLLSQLHYKTIVAKMLAQSAMVGLTCYEVIALPLIFIQKKTVSLSFMSGCFTIFFFLSSF